mgnify:FL=1
MRLMFSLTTLLLTLGSAFALYAITYDTRQIEQRLLAQERAAERALTDIAVLRAERAHLARPERIEPLARSIGMAPAARDSAIRVIDLVPLEGLGATGARK